MSHGCDCGHDQPIDDLVLKALKAAIEQYPEIIPYLEGPAAKIVEDGVGTHMKFEPIEAFIDSDADWDDWEVTDADIDRAVAEWDRLMPDYAGMLDAEIEVDEDAE